MCSNAAKVSSAVLPRMRILKLNVHLNLHTYTPHQLLIRARNRSDVCSWNRIHVKATRKQVMSKRKASTGLVNADLTSPVQRWRYCCRMKMCPFYSTLAISTRLSLVLTGIYLFTYICSVRVVLLFILGHHDAL